MICYLKSPQIVFLFLIWNLDTIQKNLIIHNKWIILTSVQTADEIAQSKLEEYSIQYFEAKTNIEI